MSWYLCKGHNSVYHCYFSLEKQKMFNAVTVVFQYNDKFEY